MYPRPRSFSVMSASLWASSNLAISFSRTWTMYSSCEAYPATSAIFLIRSRRSLSSLILLPPPNIASGLRSGSLPQHPRATHPVGRLDPVLPQDLDREVLEPVRAGEHGAVRQEDSGHDVGAHQVVAV